MYVDKVYCNIVLNNSKPLFLLTFTGVTTKKEPVFSECLGHNLLVCEGSVLAVVVTLVISPAQFQVHLPFGAVCLRTLHDDERRTDLEMLTSDMQEYYKNTSTQLQMCLPAPGELKAHCEIKEGKLDCSRVRVIDVKGKEKLCQVQVFFIDFGYMEWVPEKQLHPLSIKFLHLPPQALECRLTGVEIPDEGWNPAAASHLSELTKNQVLVAYVTHVDRDHQRLGVILLDTSEDQDININETFLRKFQIK
ncbi:tudor domain-containing protein 1-like [Homarus americanus]|uniref:tudor domain-containing protein 1-like n=1 Tax=Homarus americanus TaxID=6706 RepID=UPI001C46AC72|nr:tudor domain-containing protein 1-like [Homarus americanus]